MSTSPRQWDSSYRWRLAAIPVFAGALAIRLPGLSTDLWLDELWSLQGVREAGSWSDLLLGTRIDNNHHLNSLYLYLVGPDASPVVLRLLAFLSGIATVATAWAIGARESRVAAAVAAALFGSSYLMVFYASEARGYATVVWLTLAAWYCIQRYADTPRIAWAAGFAVCSIAGVMAHQTYMMFFVGAYVWFDAHQSSQRSLRMTTASAQRLFLVPTALIVVFYVVALRGQETGGGPPDRYVTAAAQTLSAVSGGPQAGVGLWIAGALVAIVFASSIWNARRRGDDRWLLYVASGIVIPTIVTIVRQPPTLPPRYLIVPASVLLLGASIWISRRIAQGGAAAAGAIVLLAAHVAGGVFQSTGEAASRGHYRDALEQIVASSTGSPITIASSDVYAGHDTRTSMVVAHYVRMLPGGERVRYVVADEYPSNGVEWMIVESLGEPPRPTVLDPTGRTYSLTKTYPAGNLSGTTWYVYRRT